MFDSSFWSNFTSLCLSKDAENGPIFPFIRALFIGKGISSGDTLHSTCSLCFPHKTEYKPRTTKMEPITLHSQVQKRNYHVRLRNWKNKDRKWTENLSSFNSKKKIIIIICVVFIKL